jgi:hypothetical protein
MDGRRGGEAKREREGGGGENTLHDEVPFVGFVSLKGEPSLSSVTDAALLKAQNLLFSAKNLSEEDRMTLGGRRA